MTQAAPHARSRLGRSTVVALVTMTVVLLGACGSGSGNGSSNVTHIGITGADGKPTSLADLKGTPLVVNMWATWCSPCVNEMPALDQVASSSTGVTVIGVNVGDTATAAATFATKLGVHYAQYTDPDGKLSTALKVTGLPATAFVAADGTVLEVHQGAYTADTLRAAIQQHFPGPDGGTTP